MRTSLRKPVAEDGAPSTAIWLLSFGDLLTLLLCFFLALVATGELQLGQAKVSTGEEGRSANKGGTGSPGTSIANDQQEGVELSVTKSDLGTLATQTSLVELQSVIRERGGKATIHACGRDVDDALSFGSIMRALIGAGTSRVTFGGRECDSGEQIARAKIVVSYGE